MRDVSTESTFKLPDRDTSEIARGLVNDIENQV